MLSGHKIVYIRIAHPHFDKIKLIGLAAFMHGRELSTLVVT